MSAVSSIIPRICFTPCQCYGKQFIRRRKEFRFQKRKGSKSWPLFQAASNSFTLFILCKQRTGLWPVDVYRFTSGAQQRTLGAYGITVQPLIVCGCDSLNQLVFCLDFFFPYGYNGQTTPFKLTHNWQWLILTQISAMSSYGRLVLKITRFSFCA